MAQIYSDPSRESDPHALPDVEVFYYDGKPGTAKGTEPDEYLTILCGEEGAEEQPGWYYWFCFPGCLPDSEPCGPYDSEAEAIADAQAYSAA